MIQILAQQAGDPGVGVLDVIYGVVGALPFGQFQVEVQLAVGASHEEEKAGRVTPDFIRLSVGIGDVEDIIADLDQALARAAQ